MIYDAQRSWTGSGLVGIAEFTFPILRTLSWNRDPFYDALDAISCPALRSLLLLGEAVELPEWLLGLAAWLG